LILNAPKGAAKQLPLISALPECVTEAGLPEGFWFHDLRHIGNTHKKVSSESL
jgi:hypothetical protein